MILLKKNFPAYFLVSYLFIQLRIIYKCKLLYVCQSIGITSAWHKMFTLRYDNDNKIGQKKKQEKKTSFCLLCCN